MKRSLLWVLACALARPAPARAAEKITFNKDIAPIVYAHCVSCHRPGEIGPFSLLTYRDAKQHATQIGDVTARRVMPPWKPIRSNNGIPPFVDDRSLGEGDIQKIHDWVAAGAPEGDKKDLPPLPAARSGWQLGTPDVVVTMDSVYTLRADGGDVFRTFVLPIPTDRFRYVRAIEFRPGNPRVVHHANLGVDRTRSSRRLDAADPEPGYAGGMVPDSDYPPGFMLGWTPGQRPRPSPDGTAWRLEPNSDFVIQLHMQPTGKPETIQPSIGLYFTDTPPVRTPLGLRLGSETIDIPAGEANYQITDRYVLPVDVDLVAVQPHAHNLGRTMRAEARFPDGTTRQLLSITDWDFRWQDVYRYQLPVVLPKGTAVSMTFTYDNSPNNVRNPVHPPAHVVWGQNTTDEMGDLWLQIIPRNPAELGTLSADIAKKTGAEDLAAYTKVMQADPNNPLRHDSVALLSLQQGHVADAEMQFRESLRLNPDSAPAHYNLGLVFAVQRRYAEAISEFQNAVAIDPAHAEAHNNLGALLHLTGHLDEAAAQYRRAVELKPDNMEARDNLGRLLGLQGKSAEAAVVYGQTLALTPDAPAALAGLAWIRATAADDAVRQPQEAVRLAERAVQLTNRRDPTVLDVLAAAYASAQDFQKASETARQAMQLADAANMQSLWVDIRQRLQLYDRGQPFLVK